MTPAEIMPWIQDINAAAAEDKKAAENTQPQRG